jgi:hypothetical protein
MLKNIGNMYIIYAWRVLPQLNRLKNNQINKQKIKKVLRRIKNKKTKNNCKLKKKNKIFNKNKMNH